MTEIVRDFSVIEKAARAVFRPVDRRPPWQWGEDNYYVSPSSPRPGKWRSENSPWVRALCEAFANDDVHTISALCSAQSSKTETILLLLAWLICEDPAPTMWVTSSEEEASKFAAERMMPSLEACPKVAEQLPTERGRRKAKEVFFPTMPLEIIGSNAPSKLQSKPRRWLLLDEVRNWPDGALPMVLKRTRAYWNARRVIISTPEMEHDTVHQIFLEGNQQHYYVECPHCGEMQTLDWQQMKWEVNDETRPRGRYDFDKLAETVHYECKKGCKIKDTPSNRRHLTINGEWRPHNPRAPKSKVSFTWNAMLPEWVPWRELVEEFLNASKALDWGDFQPMKTFITESLGQPWKDHLRYKEETNFLDKRKVDYNIREPWPGEVRRYIAVDVQKDHMYFVCRAFNEFGGSRLIDYDKILTFDDVRAKQVELGVDADDVVIDAAHGAKREGSQGVYKAIAESGYRWKAFWGDDRAFFTYEGLRRAWTMNEVDPAIGTPMQGKVKPIRLYHWSNPTIKDRLELLMRGMGQPWEIPEKVSQDYLKQLTAERREEHEDTRGRIHHRYVKIRKDDHFRDCESMILVAAMITGAIGFPEEFSDVDKGKDLEIDLSTTAT